MRALKTDLYQLTMAAAYFHRGFEPTRVTCEAFMRRLPPRRRFVMMAGLQRISTYLRDLRFTQDEIAYLREVPMLRAAMTPAFCDYLARFRFTGELWAQPEGTISFAREPLLRITAPIIEAQLAETFVLSVLNHGVKVASKAARVVLAAGRSGAKVVEFGGRRTHDEAAVDAARAAVVAGCAATSNVEAGMRHGLPLTGTMAHMWVMAHALPGVADQDSERSAFAHWVETFPDAASLLVDTYDTLRGVEMAIAAAGDKLRSVRLDSGDLEALSRGARKLLDAAGLKATTIVASSGLDEHAVARLCESGAPIDAYGVGENIVEPVDAPITGIVYKLVENHTAGRSVAKKSSGGKATMPGVKQVRRTVVDGRMVGDEIGLASEGPGGLLVQVMADGAVLPEAAATWQLEVARARAAAELAALPDDLRMIPGDPAREGQDGYPVEVSPLLEGLSQRLWSGADR
ncbi:MAG: nicotinate phosphoribosyltransferase [Deltaproteobacteria bacterium]|nr:nicotinate phosphoribosyltransferase [Deltaproteobacteria bacterium]